MQSYKKQDIQYHYAKLSQPIPKGEPEASLKETLGLDSLDLVDIVVLIEQHFGVTLKGPDFVGVVTFKDFYELLNSKING